MKFLQVHSLYGEEKPSNWKRSGRVVSTTRVNDLYRMDCMSISDCSSRTILKADGFNLDASSLNLNQA